MPGAAVQRAKRSVALLAMLTLSSMAVAEEADKKRQFELPTYSGEKPSHYPPEKPGKPGQLPDSRELYERVLACWPAPSYMRAEVSLIGRFRNDQSSFLDETGNISNASRASVGLLARIPLYSASEMDREREREYMRRVKVADSVGAFLSVLAERQKNRRELELMRALERRSQERVKIGVAETGEQVRYLEKVAGLEGTLLQQRGQIEKSRLELIGHCSAATADGIDRHLRQFIDH